MLERRDVCMYWRATMAKYPRFASIHADIESFRGAPTKLLGSGTLQLVQKMAVYILMLLSINAIGLFITFVYL